MIQSLLDIRHEVSHALPLAPPETVDSIAILAQAGMEERDEGTWGTLHDLNLMHPIHVAAMYSNYIWERAQNA